MTSMASLIAAAAFFTFIHIGISGTVLRNPLVSLLGERLYQGVYSLASLGGIFWLVRAYNDVMAAGTTTFLWTAPVWLSHAGALVMLLAFLLAVPGLTTPSPTLIGTEGTVKNPKTGGGILAVTRHPFLWGVILWAAFHIAANGDTASLLFFGTFLVISLPGTFSIDAKRRISHGEAWAAFEQRTSNIPFAAILNGRAKLRAGEIGWWRLALALAAYGVLLYAHPWLFGVYPFAA